MILRRKRCFHLIGVRSDCYFSSQNQLQVFLSDNLIHPKLEFSISTK